MSQNSNRKNLTVISAIGILLLFFYFADSILGTRDIASSSIGAERARERKAARTEIASTFESASSSIDDAKELVLKEWGSDPKAGYEKFRERVEAVYPTPEVDPVLNEFE
jgi:hypothetical protein